jgi:hypothetical protein
MLTNTKGTKNLMFLSALCVLKALLCFVFFVVNSFKPLSNSQ